MIGGLPRSGSTLLCNILNQNPKFHASSTSVLPAVVGTIVNTVSNLEEMKTYIIHDKKEAERMMKDSIQGYVQGWYKGKEIVFDKGRGWGHNLNAINTVFPDAKLFVMVRDPRNIFASVEKQHQNFPLFDQAQTPVQKTVWQRASEMFSTEGLIGAPLNGVEDMLRRKNLNVRFIKYEDLTANPQKVMETIYGAIGEPMFQHDFEKVENTAIDVDGLYLNKFPHKGDGKVIPSDPDAWKEYVAEDVAKNIMQTCTMYNEAFGYS